MLRLMPAQKKPSTAFGAKLITLRKARGLTQVQLAHILGIHQSTLSYHECDGGIPAGDLLLKLARTLGISVDDLLGNASPTATPSPAITPEAKRYWRRFQQLMDLPEKDRRAVLRLLDSMTKGHHTDTAKAKTG